MWINTKIIENKVDIYTSFPSIQILLNIPSIKSSSTVETSSVVALLFLLGNSSYMYRASQHHNSQFIDQLILLMVYFGLVSLNLSVLYTSPKHLNENLVVVCLLKLLDTWFKDSAETSLERSFPIIYRDEIISR